MKNSFESHSSSKNYLAIPSHSPASTTTTPGVSTFISNNSNQIREDDRTQQNNYIQHPSPPKEKYCHYYVNYGKCNYESKSGNKCKFAHEVAPLCKSGINCNRMKCMFSHPRPLSTNFLSNNYQYMSPWQVMPHLTQKQPVPNPWRGMSR